MSVDVRQDRVLVFAPRGRDAELTCQVLAKAGHTAHVVAGGAQLIAALRDGAACAIITQEALVPSLARELAAELAAQPPWSDFPLIVLTGHTQASPADLGNVTVLERPVSPMTLLTAVRSAVRGRQRQYQARAAIQQRDQFLAMLGHELRNPLGAIVLAAEPHARAPEKMAAHLDLIARQANHLARLVDDLLDVARVTSGKVRLHREAVDTDALIDSCVAGLADRAHTRGIAVEPAISPAVIEADPVRLEQIVTNLLTNAIKYSPSGTTVRLTTAVRDGVWALHVRDQGIGIAAEMLPRVFDLFAQAESSLARADGGMGIGLTLVDRLVRLHDGTIRVISDGAGKGSEFIVTLPVGAPSAIAAAPEPAPGGGAAIAVVLVEDNDDLRELSKSMLEALGCRVEVAADGHAGLALILGSRPALAIVDIGLPGLDGFAIAEQVRRSLGDTLVMVAVTGYGQRYDRERALASGFDAHIPKPLRATAIQAMIDRARAKDSYRS